MDKELFMSIDYIKVTCEFCGAGFRVKDDIALRKAKCEHCGGLLIQIPAAPLSDSSPLEEAIRKCEIDAWLEREELERVRVQRNREAKALEEAIRKQEREEEEDDRKREIDAWLEREESARLLRKQEREKWDRVRVKNLHKLKNKRNSIIASPVPTTANDMRLFSVFFVGLVISIVIMAILLNKLTAGAPIAVVPQVPAQIQPPSPPIDPGPEVEMTGSGPSKSKKKTIEHLNSPPTKIGSGLSKSKKKTIEHLNSPPTKIEHANITPTKEEVSAVYDIYYTKVIKVGFSEDNAVKIASQCSKRYKLKGRESANVLFNKMMDGYAFIPDGE
jgi:hypothetical protein